MNMKYLRQENNRFIFEDDGEELSSTNLIGVGVGIFYKKIVVWADFDVHLCGRIEPYKDIQTAVQMMTILKEEGMI